MSRVSTKIIDHVAFVTLTRGEKMNAFDDEMAEAVVDAGTALINHETVRAVVLSGEGRAFSAGLDLSNFSNLATRDPEEWLGPRTHGDANLMQEVALVWRKVPVPVIAALHGVAYGAGLQLALGADIRIAHPETKLSIMEAKWGMVPDMGGMVILPKLVRSDVMRQLIYTADPVLAPKAADWGLVTEVADDPLAAATALAEKIAVKSPSGTRAAKRLIAVAESGASEKEMLLEETREQVALIGKPHQLELIMATQQGRPPKFE